MSTIDVQPQSPLSADHNMISKPIEPSDRSESPHDNHEANKGNQTNLAEEVPSPSPENEPDPSSGTPLSPELDTPLDDTISAAVNTPLSGGLKDTLTPQAAKATAVNSPAKKTLSISTSVTAKAKGGKPSPVATKTAGTSPGKPATVVSRSISGGGTTPTSPLKRATTSTMSKSAASITRPTPTGATAPTRRTSLATASIKSVPPTTSRTTLASSMTGKTIVAEPGIALNRASVISPSGSISSLQSVGTAGVKPRAPISEAATKKAAPTARSAATARSTTSLVSTTSRASTRPLSGLVGKSSVVRTGSISSIKEDKEDGNIKALEDLRNRFNATSDELKSKTETVAELEGQVGSLKLSLETLQSEIETKNSQAIEIKSSKAALELTFQESKEELTRLQVKYEESKCTLISLKEELVAAATSSNELNTKLNKQISTLELELSSTKENLVTLQTSHDAAASEAATAAAADKEALFKAHSELKAIMAETEQLKQVQISASDEAQKKIEMLEKGAQEAGNLQVQLNALNTEKEETATKISELEIEILELKEAREVLEDERDQLKNTIKTLQGSFDQSQHDITKAAEDLKTAESRHEATLGDLQYKHAEELVEAAKKHTQVSQTLQAIHRDLEATNLELDKAKKTAVDAEEVYKLKSLEVEQAYMAVQNELTERIASISQELESQETQYNARVQGVKDEHGQLLQQAFERAKHEAGQDHAKELQALRTQSKATIEEIQAANSNTLREHEAEHASNLESEMQGFSKQLSHSKLELKATQDDLAKAKTALEVSRSEVQSLKEQLEEVKAATEAEVHLTPEHIAENERLKRALSGAEADLSVTTEILNLTKSSMTEMSDHHARDLEEAAKARAEEMSKLRVTHEEEVILLTKEKDVLSVRLSDMEGELATVRAELDSLKVPPKANNNDIVASHDVISPSSGGVTDEMLSQVHEAHNLKLGDLMAEHDKAVKMLQQQLDDTQKKIRDLGEEVSRKTMEIQFMESENDEQSEAVTRLKDDTQILRDQLVKAGIEPQVRDDADEE